MFIVALHWGDPGVTLSSPQEGRHPATTSSQLSTRHLAISKSVGKVHYLELEFQLGNSRGEVTLGQRDLCLMHKKIRGLPWQSSGWDFSSQGRELGSHMPLGQKTKA